MENTLLTLQYVLAENDLLQANLYLIKENGRLKKIIFKNWILWCMIYLAIAVVFLVNKNYFPALGAAVVATIRLIMLPGRMKERIFKNTRKELKVYEGRLGSNFTITITTSLLTFVGNTKESKTKISELVTVIETGQHFFIRIMPETVIVPKAQLQNVADTRKRLQSISKDLNIPYVSDTLWQW